MAILRCVGSAYFIFSLTRFLSGLLAVQLCEDQVPGLVVVGSPTLTGFVLAGTKDNKLLKLVVWNHLGYGVHAISRGGTRPLQTHLDHTCPSIPNMISRTSNGLTISSYLISKHSITHIQENLSESPHLLFTLKLASFFLLGFLW